MLGSHFGRLVTKMAFALMLAAPVGAFAQGSGQPPATFKDRFPVEQPSTMSASPEATNEPKVATTTVARAKRPRSRVGETRPRSRVVVVPRSFLDAGTEVLPGERKFTDYAFPVGPYSTPQSVVSNIGGRVGWHNSPLPGPFFPSTN